MLQQSGVTAVANVIELAIAPVFLLTAIGTMLAVLTNRLGRIIDRARLVEERVPPGEADPRSPMHGELATLARRVKLIQRAILLCTATALLICSVIVVLFLGTLLDVDFAAPVALLFIGAMLAFLGGLLVWCLRSSAAIRSRVHPLWTALELLAVATATPRRPALPERRLRPLDSYQTSETPH